MGNRQANRQDIWTFSEENKPGGWDRGHWDGQCWRGHGAFTLGDQGHSSEERMFESRPRQCDREPAGGGRERLLRRTLLQGTETSPAWQRTVACKDKKGDTGSAFSMTSFEGEISFCEWQG